jgi:siderophore synthetase component
MSTTTTQTNPMQSMQHTLLAPDQAAAHLTPAIWERANRMLVRKAIAEYAHELIVEPQRIRDAQGDGYACYELESDDDSRVYTFEARLLALRHWSIRAGSIVCTQDGDTRPLDALAFILDVKARLGIKEEMLPIYLDEISSTLYGAAYKAVKEGPDAPDLLTADFQAIETAMSEGHPGFVANNGRLGFDAGDYRAFAPEAASVIQIVWLAVHRDNAAFHHADDLDYDRLMNEELGAQTIARFKAIVEARGCRFDDYRLMPAHPWQWFNKLSIAFAAYVATNRIICVGYGDDRYLAQQSIRTFFNVSNRSKRYVKTSLSILNMGFMRGLSPYYMSGTPAINDFIKGLVAGDAYLHDKGFTILREVASMGFRNRYYEAAVQADTPYKKMFSALWRENPLALAGDGQRLMTMAALLHTDRDGRALLPALIEASGVGTEAWLDRYLDAYLAPLVHCFYKYDLVFMPHGENLILVLENHVPVRAIMKDIAEESAILNKDAQLPENVRRLAVDVPEHVKLLAIFIDVFDGFFRYMNQILVEQDCCTEDLFWNAVARCIGRYQAAHPELAPKLAQYDLFAPEFLHSCLNRLQLGNNLQMVNLADPAGNLKMAGNLQNPLAGRRAAYQASQQAAEHAGAEPVEA